MKAAAAIAPASAVTFEAMPSGRVLVKLGLWTVGSVEPFPFPGSRHKAHWRVSLPGVEMRATQPAASIDDAKAAAEDRVRQWIDATPLTLRRPDLCVCRGAPA